MDVNSNQYLFDIPANFVHGGDTKSISGTPASVTSGFFVPSVKEVSPVLWRVNRAEYNTRKGNKPSVLMDAVEACQAHKMLAKLLNHQEAQMSNQVQVLPVVSVVNNQTIVTSKRISEDFSKRHDHVIRDIQEIIKKVM